MKHSIRVEFQVQYHGQRHPIRSGFTLIELIAALALSALLVVGMLGIARQLTSHRRLLESQVGAAPWMGRLEERLSDDFRNCRGVLVRPQSLLFSGYRSVDFSSGQSRHVPSQIEYRFVDTRQGTLLVRTEHHWEEPAGDNERGEVMCFGLDRIELPAPLETDVPPGVLALVWRGVCDGREVKIPMYLVRHGGFP